MAYNQAVLHHQTLQARIIKCYENFKLQHLQELATIYRDGLESVVFPSIHILS